MIKTKKSQREQLSGYFTPENFIMEAIDGGDSTITGKENPALLWSKRFEEDKFIALYHLSFLPREKWFSPSVEYLYRISDLLITKLSRHTGLELEREGIVVELSDDELHEILEQVPFVVGMEYVDRFWVESIWENLLSVFKREIHDYRGQVATYFTEKNSSIQVSGRVFFHLVENIEEEFPFAFMATYSNKPPKSKKTIHTPLKNALTEFKDDDKKLISLISSVIKAAEQSDFISGLLESGELYSPIKLTALEAHAFLKEVPLYEAVGIMCRVPDWWKKKKNAMRLTIAVGEKEPSKVGLDAIMDFSPRLYMDEHRLSEAEIREFLSMAQGLVKYKGKWVEIDRSKLNAALEAFEKVIHMSQDGILTLGEALRMELNTKESLGIDSDDIEISVSNGQWFKKMRETLTNPVASKKEDLSPTFRATLRPYQQQGYYWLRTIAKLGFGACLADDMGLGKTVQVIALLEHMRTQQVSKALLVLPASLIGNWQKEIEKFAPELPCQVLHPSAFKSKEQITIDDTAFLCMTTYGMAKRIEALKDRKWDVLILDEAQAIKNPTTKQTKCIKQIKATTRIAMTGTPIENHLGDLWSLFDFLNPGLLGNRSEFKQFTKELKIDLAGYAKLRKMIQPFLLRRLKTDKTIISDLPEKIEIREYAALSKKQIALYQRLVKEISDSIKGVEGINRKGLVLSSIMKCKQICNHPDQYLGLEEYKPSASGKFKQLSEICQTIYEKRERVLIFTQFKEMTQPLADYLKEIFFTEGLILHGGTSVKKRSQMVERFNGEQYVPYMVLSLKAGGVGLNLTGANHVIHFDRWWNPAVENQATDRAFRIGQTKNVMVHKFVTKGTIEEKIDAMIADKQKLAKDILSSKDEKWITEYDNDELMELFKLEGI